MHRELKTLLQKAIGRSEFIMAVMIDIRGFSAFSLSRESSEAAVFLKKVYQTILDKYFPEAAFFKPTGDGLVIIVPYTEESLKESCTNTVKKCLDLISHFPNLCNGDPSIYFDVPRKLGIGLSRGAATCLVSGDKTLDYSGRVLNLASRLVDIARPSGLVCDGKFGIELLPDELRDQFNKENVYLRSVAEKTPIEVYTTKGPTVISPTSKQPLEKIDWATEELKYTLNDIEKRTPHFIHILDAEPLDPKQVKVQVIYPDVGKRKRTTGLLRFWSTRNFQYSMEAGTPRIIFHFKAIAKHLRASGVKGRWKTTVQIRYPKK